MKSFRSFRENWKNWRWCRLGVTVVFVYLIGYDTALMNTVLRTAKFNRWLSALKDARGKARIVSRIRAAERGHFGDCRFVGEGVSEMRIHFGPGYRVYFTRDRGTVYVLLCGGTKHGQARDITKAQEMARLLKDD